MGEEGNRAGEEGNRTGEEGNRAGEKGNRTYCSITRDRCLSACAVGSSNSELFLVLPESLGFTLKQNMDFLSLTSKVIFSPKTTHRLPSHHSFWILYWSSFVHYCELPIALLFLSRLQVWFHSSSEKTVSAQHLQCKLCRSRQYITHPQFYLNFIPYRNS